MSEDRPIYVIDTNILVDYVDVIPGEEGKQPLEPTIDLSQAHVVIPTMVVRELSKFKGEISDRGDAARIVLRRMYDLLKSEGICTLGEIYGLQAPITVKVGSAEDPDAEQLISILPVHKDFCECLPFEPASDDKDGQIILTAMAASMAKQGELINGKCLKGHTAGLLFEGVTLLTNDNGLATRAISHGIKTDRYGYKYPEPYTGRRDIVVTKHLFHEFFNSIEGIPRELFENEMPDEPPLVANEFIVMYLEDEADYPGSFDRWDNQHFRNIGRYDAKTDHIVRLRYATDFPVWPKNPGQAIYAEALMDPNIAAVICTGPAGSGKTYMPTIYGYQACLSGQFIGIAVVPCENRSKLGALPGKLSEKMDPEVQPLKNALRNYLLDNDPKFKRELKVFHKFGTENENGGDNDSTNSSVTNGKRKNKGGNGGHNGNSNGNGNGNGNGKQSIKNRLNDRVNLIWEGFFSSVPIELARGRDFAHEMAIYDEFQDQNATQADTLIKRLGAEGKIILTGDIEQIHAPYLDRDNNGLVYASRQLLDSPMVAQVHFTENEVVRHPLVQEIAVRQKRNGNGRGRKSPKPRK